MLFVARTPGLVRALAETVSDILENAAWPEAVAVTMTEVDEDNALWAVEGYYEAGPERSAINHLMALNNLAAPVMTIEQLPDHDWVARSLEGLSPVIAGRFFVHGSHDRNRRRKGGINLEVNAGTAFGTGHHGTTRGCLLALDRLLKMHRPARIIDIGCGTGVLALAAARATRQRVIATDIDPQATRITRLNARANALDHVLETVTTPGTASPAISARGPYDLIMANILARPLIGLAKDLANLAAPGATIILSGLTCNQEQWVFARYRQHKLMLSDTIRQENWATLVLKKPAGHTGFRP